MNAREWVKVAELTTEWHEVGVLTRERVLPLSSNAFCKLPDCLRHYGHSGDHFPTPDDRSAR